MILGGFQALTFLDHPERLAGWNGGQEAVADTAVSDCGSGMQGASNLTLFMDKTVKPLDSSGTL